MKSMQHGRTGALTLVLALVLALVGTVTATAASMGPASAASGADTIIAVAGTGVAGYDGDGFAATKSLLRFPDALASDASHNLFIADYRANVVRKVDASGVISTVAGGGRRGNSAEDNGDGGPAVQAQLNHPAGVAADNAGNIYIADTDNHRIRKVGPSGIITTFAGIGTYGDSGDGGPATQAEFNFPAALAMSPVGDLYIVDGNVNKVRRVDKFGTITTFAGTGDNVFNGDGGLAVNASIGPADVTVGSDGAVYIADFSNGRIRKVDAGGRISTVAGTGEFGSSGDGGPATAAQISPANVAVDQSGNLYIASLNDARVRRVDTATKIVTTVAGTGELGSSGDGGPAAQATVSPWDIIADLDGSVYVAEETRVRCFGPNRLHLDEGHAPGRPRVGDQITYSYTVDNQAGTTSTGVKLTVPLPADMAFAAAAGGCALSAGIITCQAGSLAPGGRATVTVTLRALRAGVVRQTASVSSVQSDPYARDNTLVFPTLVSAVDCGRVIAASTVLTKDIGPCADGGAVIGADNVTLDLGGHRIYGFPGPSSALGDVAGVVLQGRKNVTLDNGRISDFDAGVSVVGGGSNTLTGLVLENNIGPDDPFGSRFGDGVLIEDSSANSLTNNTISNNGIFDGIGIYGQSDSNIVQGNTIKDTVGPGDRGPAGQGMIINGATAGAVATVASSNRVEGNIVRNNASAGISNVNHVQGSIRGNTVEGNGMTNSSGNGIGLQAGFRWDPAVRMETVVQGNEVHGNGEDGIQVRRKAGGNQILANNASDNGVRQGVDLRDFNADCGTNAWLSNTWGAAGFSPACTSNGGRPVAAATAPQARTSASYVDPRSAWLQHADAWDQFMLQGRRR